MFQDADGRYADGRYVVELRWKEAKPATPRQQQWVLNRLLTQVLDQMDKVSFPEEPWPSDLD